jgi:WD40 repeat protein
MRKLSLDGPVCSIAFSPDGRFLIGDRGCLRGYDLSFWELPSGAEVLRGTYPDHCSGPALTVSPDGALLGYRGRLLDLALARQRLGQPSGDDRPVMLGPVLPLELAGCGGMAFSADGRLLVAGTPWELEVWDVPGRQRLARRTDVRCSSLALAADNTLAVALPGGRAVALWDINLERPLGHLEYRNVERLAFSADGKLLATLTRHPSKVRIWDVAQRRCVTEFKAFGQSAWALAFHPGGRLVASAGQEGVVRLWDVVTHQEVACLNWQVGIIRSLAFAPDGMTAAGAGHNAIVLWDVEEP